MNLSIILIAKDKNTDMAEALGYIYKQQYATNYEVLCVKEKNNDIKIPNQYKNYVKIIEDVSISKALNNAINSIDSTYLTFMFSTDIWHESTISTLLKSIKNKHTDCVIYGMNLNKKYKADNVNTTLLDFQNFSEKLQEEVFFVSETGIILYSLPEFINNKIYKTDFIKENNIYFEEDEDFEQLFYYKFMFSDPKFIILNQYLSRRIFVSAKNIITLYNKVEEYLKTSPIDDRIKIKYRQKLQLKKIAEMICFSLPFKEYKNYYKMVKDEIQKMFDEKKIYEYEIKMDTLYKRFYKFMNTNYLFWYFWYKEHYIK